KILDEYPDGSQILREILQNFDDAGSTEQIFILDHNTYPSNNLIPPDFVNSGLNL
ncbi:14115_t:CDS:1, partial [Funneliformis geosporum]